MNWMLSLWGGMVINGHEMLIYNAHLVTAALLIMGAPLFFFILGRGSKRLRL